MLKIKLLYATFVQTCSLHVIPIYNDIMIYLIEKVRLIELYIDQGPELQWLLKVKEGLS